MKILKYIIMILIVGAALLSSLFYIFVIHRGKFCSFGYSSSVNFTGAQSIDGPCQKNAIDTGKVCKENSECSTNICIPSRSFRNKCPHTQSCVGVTGKCAPTYGDQYRASIPKKDNLQIRLLY